MTPDRAGTRPDPGPLPKIALGAVADERLANGVRVVAVRRAQVPLAHLRLRVPLGDVGRRDGASLRLLPKALLAGTAALSGTEVAAAIQRLGASVAVGADVDHLVVAASTPASHLDEALELVGAIVAHPSFPGVEVAGERERVAQEVVQESADPGALAARALGARLFPGHPYSDPLPGASAVRRTGRGTLARFHDERVRPRDSSLVVVGDVDPDAAVDAVARHLAAWSPVAGSDAAAVLAVPAIPSRDSAIRVAHRAGAVQSNLRIGARCSGRDDPQFPALLVATTIFGGGFTSRLFTNLRERNGFTYSPQAFLDERRLAAAVLVGADVATEVTARALAEVRYELARISTAGVSPDEVESSRRYVIGNLAMASATQSGLADLLSGRLAHDLDPSDLEGFVSAVADLDVDAVSQAAGRLFAPADMTTVVVGDADRVHDELSRLDVVTVTGK